MADLKFERAVEDFVDAFEEVFHRDWEYTRCLIDSAPQGATFIKPGVADETEDWGNRGALLEAYRRLVSLLKQRVGRPTIDDPREERSAYLLRKSRDENAS
jgi:hypothetical protein